MYAWIMAALMAAAPLPLPFISSASFLDGDGVELETQVADPGMTLIPADPERPSVWYAPVASRTLDDGTVQIWYQRVEKTAEAYDDQRTLCLGEIRDGEWVLPAVHPESPSWGGPNNVVMTRSPHKPTWGGFNVFQIVEVDGLLRMLYWDQPDEEGKAGAMVATSTDGKSWEKRPGAVFTEHNDAYSLIRLGDTYTVYQTALADWPDKPYPDNLDKYKRVITIRRSPDLVTWSAQEPLLTPDEDDAPEAEFYLFKVFEYGHGYGGLIMKYFGDPNAPNKHSAIIKNELATSADGLHWERPSRDFDPGFWSYADPFVVNGRMHFATWKEGAMVTYSYPSGRMMALANDGEVTTAPFARPDSLLALNANVSKGWVIATLCDPYGEPVKGLEPYRIEGVDDGAIVLSWDVASMPGECTLRLQTHDAKVFGVTVAE